MPIKFTQIIAADTPEHKVDQIGLAILRDNARAQDLVVVGDVTRVRDESVYQVTTTGPDGEPAAMFVEASLAGEAAGSEPAGRSVTWQAETRPADSGSIPAFDAHKMSEAVARLQLPEEISREGALIQINHNLGGEVTVKALAADGTPVNYLFVNEITDDMVEMQLVPELARSVEIVLDEIPAPQDDKES